MPYERGATWGRESDFHLPWGWIRERVFINIDCDKNEVIDEMELSAFTNLFQNLQDYVVGILNEDEILQQMGCVFLSENSLDIEYQIRDALNKQGMACVVMTPKATY